MSQLTRCVHNELARGRSAPPSNPRASRRSFAAVDGRIGQRLPWPVRAGRRRAASRESLVAVAQSSRWPVALAAIISPRSSPSAADACVRRQPSAHLMRDQPVRDGRLTRGELVDQVAEAADLTRKDADVVLETVLGNIAEALRRGEKVELRGFGSFRLRHRDARRGRHPKTGGRVDVPPKLVPYFRPGKELKGADQPGADRDPAAAGVRVGSVELLFSVNYFASRVASLEDVTRHPQNDRTRCLGRIASRRHPRPGTGRPEVHPGPEARRGTRRAPCQWQPKTAHFGERRLGRSGRSPVDTHRAFRVGRRERSDRSPTRNASQGCRAGGHLATSWRRFSVAARSQSWCSRIL